MQTISDNLIDMDQVVVSEVGREGPDSWDEIEGARSFGS